MMQTLDISLLWMEPIANNQISLWQTSIKIFGVFKIQYNSQYCWVLFCFLDDFRFLLSLIYFLNFHLSVYQYLILAYIANAPAPPPDITITNDGDTNLNKSHLSNSTDCRRTLELFFFLIHIYTPILHTCVVKTTDTYDTKKLLLSVALLFVAKTNYQWCKRGFVNIS